MNKELTPTEYFDRLKEMKNEVTHEALDKYMENALILATKYRKTGQVKALKKILFHASAIEKEHELIDLGVNTFLYRDNIEEFIEKVGSNVVKIIEMKNYPREIPDEAIDIIDKVGGLFDEMYIVFTYYTGKVEKQIAKERRDKDPILFGTFKQDDAINDRFYFLYDWQDEYCDLTLSKMLEVMNTKERKVDHSISIPETLDDFRSDLKKMDEANRFSDQIATSTTNKNHSILSKILKRLKK